MCIIIIHLYQCEKYVKIILAEFFSIKAGLFMYLFLIECQIQSPRNQVKNLKNQILSLIFSIFLISLPITASADEISGSSGDYAFDSEDLTLTINDTGHVSGEVSSAYAGATLNVDASGTNGVDGGSSNAIYNVDNININSGLVKSVGVYAIRNISGGDQNIYVGEEGTIEGNVFSMFLLGDEVNITNAGNIIGGNTAIVVNDNDLNVVNSGTITSAGLSFIGISGGRPQNIEVTNESSGVIDSGAYFSGTETNILTNRGLITGNVKTLGNQESIQIINDGGTIGSLESPSEISLDYNNSSSFQLVSGTINADMEVGIDDGDTGVSEGVLEGIGQEVNLEGGVYNGDIEFITGATVNLGATDFNGTIKSKYISSYSPDYGSVNIVSTANLDSGLNIGGDQGVTYVVVTDDGEGNAANATYQGATIKSDYLNIDDGSTLNLASDMAVDGLIAANISGTLNFGDSDRIFTGDVIGTSSAVLSLKDANHTIDGDLTLVSGDEINVKIGSESIGKITVNGAANVAGGVGLNVDIISSYDYLTDGYNSIILDGGESSTITAISDSNISANSIDVNNYDVLTFDTFVSEDGTDLVLNVTREDLETVIEHEEEYSESVRSVVRDLKPQENESLKLARLVQINGATSAIKKRINNYHAKSLIQKPSVSKYNFKSGKKTKSGISSGDKSQNAQAWIRAFGSKAKQKNITDNGYRSKTSGIAMGIDKHLNKDAVVGFSFTKSESSVSATSSNKVTDIDGYQVSVYGSRFFNEYFISGILGFSANENKSTRVIESTSQIAKAKYSNYNYISRLGVGAIYNDISDSGFSLSPELSSTFVNSKTDSYEEGGAGSLNLNVKQNYNEFLEVRMGFDLAYKPTSLNKISNLFSDKINVTPKLHSSYGYNFKTKAEGITSSFVGQSATFNTSFSSSNPASVRLGASLIFYDLEATRITLDYLNERRSGYNSHFGSVKFGYDF